MGIIRLEKKVGKDRLETACNRALAIRGFSFKSVKSILDLNLENRPLPEATVQLAIVHDNLRGPDAYFTQTLEVHNANPSDNRPDEGTQALWHGQSTGNTA